MIRPITIAAALALATCATQNGQPQQQAAVPTPHDIAPLTDEELASGTLGPQCREMWGSAIDPDGFCACAKSAILSAQRSPYRAPNELRAELAACEVRFGTHDATRHLVPRRPSQRSQIEQPQLALDGSPMVTNDAEFGANVMGPPERCASMLRDAADPEGLCDCLRAVALEADAQGITDDTAAKLMHCFWHYAGGNSIVPKKPQ
jgi:hypothetical protein